MIEATAVPDDIELHKRINFRPMEQALDQVRQELTDLLMELLALPADDFTQRSELKEERHPLRQRSAELVQDEALHDADTLTAAYQHLQEVRDWQLDLRLKTNSASIGGAGIDSGSTSAINTAMEAGLGTEEIEARHKVIPNQLRTAR
jgi:hypothetical protein